MEALARKPALSLVTQNLTSLSCTQVSQAAGDISRGQVACGTHQVQRATIYKRQFNANPSVYASCHSAETTQAEAFVSSPRREWPGQSMLTTHASWGFRDGCCGHVTGSNAGDSKKRLSTVVVCTKPHLVSTTTPFHGRHTSVTRDQIRGEGSGPGDLRRVRCWSQRGLVLVAAGALQPPRPRRPGGIHPAISYTPRWYTL